MKSRITWPAEEERTEGDARTIAPDHARRRRPPTNRSTVAHLRTRTPFAHDRTGLDRDAGGVRVVGGHHDPARDRERLDGIGVVRLGDHVVLPRHDDRHRVRRRPGRSARARTSLRRRPDPLRRRPRRGRAGTVDAGPRRRPLRPGIRRRRRPGHRLRRHRTRVSDRCTAPDVRGAVDGVGRAGDHRSGAGRAGLRVGQLASGLPGPAAARCSRRFADHPGDDATARARGCRCGESRAEHSVEPTTNGRSGAGRDRHRARRRQPPHRVG